MSFRQHASRQIVTTPLNTLDNGSGKCVTGMIWQVAGKIGCMVGCRISDLGTWSMLALEEVVEFANKVGL